MHDGKEIAIQVKRKGEEEENEDMNLVMVKEWNP